MIQLVRVAERIDATYGVLLFNGLPFAVTLERPWKDNAQNISCIPKGEYQCVRWSSPKFGSTWLLQGVPGRTHVLIHKGNSVADTQGCILVGEAYEGQLIAQSGKAFAELQFLLCDVDTFTLTIR